MALIGQIVYPSTLAVSMPSGLFSLIGEDGQHYVLASNAGTGNAFNVGCAETQSNIFGRTTAQWRTDLASLAMGTSGTYSFDTTVPAPGTPYFYALGWQYSTGGSNIHDIVGVRYKIVDESTVAVDGGFAYRTSGHSTVLASGYCWGSGVIDGALYAVMDTGTFFPPTECNHLLKLPLTGTDADFATGSWDDFVTLLPWAWAVVRFTTTRQYYNRVCIIDDPDGIGLLLYRGPLDGVAGEALYTVVDPVAHTHTGSNDVSADYGIPFADSGLNLAEGAGTSRDDYTGPYQGDNGVIYWARTFSDDQTQARVRQFTMDGGGNIVVGDVLNFHFTDEVPPSGLNQTVEFVMIYHEGSELLWMARSNRTYIFGSEPVPGTTSPAEYPDIEAPEVDTVDELPPAEAVLVTQRWLVRTGHIRDWGEVAVDDLRVTIKRGLAAPGEPQPYILVRVNRDNKGFGKWARRSLGEKGDRTMTLYFGGFGTARDWQFEVATTDECEIELRNLEILPTPLGH